MTLQTASGVPTLALAGAVVVVVASVGAYGALVYWVYRDASARGSDRARQWALGVALFAPVLLFYLARRRRLGTRTEPESDRERLARTLGGSVLLAWLVATVLAPPDPVTQLYYGGAAMAAAALVGYLLVVRRGADRGRRLT